MTVDGYIAGPNGEMDWTITDPTFRKTSHFSVLIAHKKSPTRYYYSAPMPAVSSPTAPAPSTAAGRYADFFMHTVSVK